MRHSLAAVPGVRGLPGRLRGVDRRVVLFDSWRGRYSDNPRAIFEAMRRRRTDHRFVWVLRRDERAPEGAEIVAPESAGHLRWLNRAGSLVFNNTAPAYFRPRDSVTYLQTWHGTPLKRIAFDIEGRATAPPRKYFDTLRREVRRWDALISPNPFSTRVFRRSFAFGGRILETGYPRNDLLLLAPDATAVRRQVRMRYGIREEVRAVLYAPTLRDSEPFSLALDLGRLTGELGDDVVVLLRAHHVVAATAAGAARSRVINVSGVGDIADLYLAADVLITDYSSAMFDFAITNKPIILFLYDLEDYRDRVRGLNLDIQAEAPGPVVRSTGEVVSLVAGLDALQAANAERHRAFVRRFCPFDDGRASERVIDAVFG